MAYKVPLNLSTGVSDSQSLIARWGIIAFNRYEASQLITVG